MKSLKFIAATAAFAVAGSMAAAHADEQLVLEEVIVTAKAPPRPTIEFVLVVAELPEYLRVPDEQAADEPIAIALAVEQPHVDLTQALAIAPARPILRL